MALEFDWVDAFTDRAFGGNGCAVVHDAGGLSAETCMAFTRETGLVECTFLEPSDVADIKVRYFLAEREIPFAGHPTVATVASMVARGVAGTGALTLETGAGLVPIEVGVEAGVPNVTMTQIAPVFGAELPADLVAAVGGLDAQDMLAPPQLVSTGLPVVIAPLRSQEALRRAVLDVDALGRLRAALPPEMAGAIEPFWVVLEGATEAGNTFSRLLLAPPNPPEDPFTGSATGAMAAYLWAHGMIEAPRLVAEQGHWLGRPGRADVEILGPRHAISGVKVSGPGYVLMSGRVNL
ncbi:Phenazine biosynthesis protein PhzF [Candidatus Rhodobacter oscarellae]|uniref:Phenazine biosynthesis protein PhzF n=1 Tax=Candidatus Rhodobacter oscarellae TaxID=1675527 RepID=A0A0J9EC15_9RHOB|nr:PhzF family phenazine biosynthesis protein [Candidatus Rhodobacter lobularis]KMW60161.1 Phenazine biosynthesis protein PhzF [Candidatus Rhodobacter lobularis]